jgi:hypothetical protein
MQHCVGEDLDISRSDSTSSSSGKDEMQVVPVGRGYVLRQSACNRPGTVEDESANRHPSYGDCQP